MGKLTPGSATISGAGALSITGAVSVTSLSATATGSQTYSNGVSDSGAATLSGSTLTVTASAPAVVLIDGQQVGETPLTSHPIALGTRDIVVKGADGTERRFTQKVTVAPVQIDVDFSKP